MRSGWQYVSINYLRASEASKESIVLAASVRVCVQNNCKKLHTDEKLT